VDLSQLRGGHRVGRSSQEMTEGGLVLDRGSYLDVNGPLAQMAKSHP
jgi:hypothetical protein